jgi:hypothetical protein
MAKLGFTFGFGARDDGMGRAMSSAFDSLTKINGALGQQNRMARGSKLGASLQGLAKGAASAAVGTARMGAGLFGAFGRGMQNRVNSFNLASMASNIRGLTQDSGELSLSMESIGASYAQQARPALAMMGVTGKRLKQLTGQAAGMAYGLNVGVETVVKTMGTLESATGGTKVFFDGLKMGTKDLVKLAEVTGMATDQLGQIGGDLVASWSFTGPQAKKTLEYMVAMGNEGGVGAKMFAQMGDQMGGINEILANQVASHMRSADEIDKVLRSSVRLAGAYAAMGLSQEEAAKAATATSNKFVEWQVGIERAQKVGGEMPDIFKDLAAVVGDTQTAMDLVALGAQDSTAGMQQFAKHVQAARASGRAIDEAVLGNLTKSFGEAGSNAVYLALSTDKGAAGLDKMATATVKADGALQQLAKTQSSGRTLQEGLDMAKEAFRMRIRSLTRGEVKGFVKEEITSLRELGNEAQKLGSDSTWGPVLKTFSVFDQMGAKGVFLHFGKQLGFDTKQMSKFGVVAENGIDAVLKMGQSIAPVMESLGMGGLTGPLAGIAGWFMLKPAQQEAIKGTITAVWDQIKGPLGKALSEGWDTFIAGIDWGGIVNAARPALRGVATALGMMVASVFPKLADFLGIGEGLAKAQAQAARAKQAQTAAAGGAGAREGYAVSVLRESGLGAKIKAEDARKKAEFLAGHSATSMAQVKQSGSLAAGATGMAHIANLMTSGQDKQLGLAAPQLAGMYQNYGNLPIIGGMAKKIAQLMVVRQAESAAARSAEFDESLSGNLGTARGKAENAAVRMQMGMTTAPALPGQGTANAGMAPKAATTMLEVAATLGDPKFMEAASLSGQTMAGMLAQGMATGTEKALVPQMTATAETAASFWPRSEPKTGPLSGGMLGNAGSTMLTMVLDGMVAEQANFELGFATVLEEATTFAMNAFYAKAQEEMRNNSITTEILGQLTGQFAGILTEDDKKVLKSSLDLSGLYGVINAVVMDGAETRKVLTSIADNTAGLKGWTPGKGSGWEITKPAGAAG